MVLPPSLGEGEWARGADPGPGPPVGVLPALTRCSFSAADLPAEPPSQARQLNGGNTKKFDSVQSNLSLGATRLDDPKLQAGGWLVNYLNVDKSFSIPGCFPLGSGPQGVMCLWPCGLGVGYTVL